MSKAKQLLESASNSLTAETYTALHEHALNNTSVFWSEIATYIDWDTAFETVRQGVGSKQVWFKGGEVNYYKQVFNAPDSAIALEILHADETKTSVTFRELETQARLLAGALQAKGVVAGDVVLICTPRRDVQIQLAFACLLLGARFCFAFFKVPLPVLKHYMQTVAAKVLVGDNLDVLQESEESTTVVATDTLFQEGADQATTFEGGGYAYSAEASTFYLLSSGTTGLPKAVATGNAGMLLAALVTYYLSTYVQGEGKEYLGLDLAWGPAFIMGVMLPLMHQKTLVITDEYFTFAHPSLVQRLNEESVVATTLPMSLFEGEVAAEKLRLQKLFLTGMAFTEAIGSGIEKNIDTKNLTALYGYGSSELAGLGLLSFTTTTPAALANQPLIPYPGVEVVVEESGRLTFSNTIPSTCVAIEGRIGNYEACWNADGLFVTSDRAAEVESSRYMLRGRIDSVVKVKGREVDLAELESFTTNSCNAQAVLVEVNNGLHAFVVTTDKTATYEDVASAIETSFGSYAVPTFHTITSLPRTAGGKVDRNYLKRHIVHE